MDYPNIPEPWYLTVVRTSGIQFLRPEKSWRPIVCVTTEATDLSNEIVLGCDGQNPNLKKHIPINNADHSTRLDIRIFHKSHSKNRKKRHLVGSVYISLGEITKKQAKPGHDVELKLSCPPPQKRSPTIGGGRKLNCATLIIRLHEPPPQPSPITITQSSSATAVDSPCDSRSGHETSSDDALSDAPLLSPIRTDLPPFTSLIDNSDITLVPPPSPPPLLNTQALIRRRVKPKKVKGYQIYSSDGEPSSCTSSEAESPYLRTPHSTKSHFPAQPQYDLVFKPASETERITIYMSHTDNRHHSRTHSHHQFPYADPPTWISPRVLPQYRGQNSQEQPPLSVMERMVDKVSPYKELVDATSDEDFDRILGKLLTEWYVVGASLLAIAGMNAAVFGFSSGTVFNIDDLALRSVAIGSIAAALGLVIDAWFLVIYSGANAAKFQKQALDVYQTYFFFSLTCRVPTFALFLSSVALMIFLISVAWAAWPSAVLVMSFLVGVMLSLQYLVFGFHRGVNLVIWCVRTAWRKLFGIRHNTEVEVDGNGKARGREPGGSGAVTLQPQALPGPSRPGPSRTRPQSLPPLDRKNTADITMPVPSLGGI